MTITCQLSTNGFEVVIGARGRDRSEEDIELAELTVRASDEAGAGVGPPADPPAWSPGLFYETIWETRVLPLHVFVMAFLWLFFSRGRRGTLS